MGSEINKQNDEKTTKRMKKHIQTDRQTETRRKKQKNRKHPSLSF